MANWRKIINRKRRDLFNALTQRLERSPVPKIRADKPVPIRSVLVIRPNHRLGNQLLITPLLQELEEVLPEAKVDVWVKGGVAPVLFKEFKQVDNITLLPKKPLRQLLRYIKGWLRLRARRYDLVVNVVNHSSSGKISTWFANAEFRLLGEINDAIRQKFCDHPHIGKYPVYSFRHYMTLLGYPVRQVPVPPLSLRLSREEILDGQQVLYSILKNERKTIAIYTFATGDKMYSKVWWAAFYVRLKEAFPDYNILEVLPVENVSQIGFQAPSFYSKELRRICAVIANTEIFIGADSGMMHLAAASGTPTLGLFKAANMSTYEPYGNGSVGIQVSDSDPDVETKALLEAVKSALRKGCD